MSTTEPKLVRIYSRRLPQPAARAGEDGTIGYLVCDYDPASRIIEFVDVFPKGTPLADQVGFKTEWTWDQEPWEEPQPAPDTFGGDWQPMYALAGDSGLPPAGYGPVPSPREFADMLTGKAFGAEAFADIDPVKLARVFAELDDADTVALERLPDLLAQLLD